MPWAMNNSGRERSCVFQRKKRLRGRSLAPLEYPIVEIVELSPGVVFEHVVAKAILDHGRNTAVGH